MTISTKPQDDDYSAVAARLAAQMLTSRAASRLTRQLLDLYLGAARINIDIWEQMEGPNPGYRVALEVRLDRPTALDTDRAHRRLILQVVKAATDREPFILDTLDDHGVRAVIAFPFDDGAAAVATMDAHWRAGSMATVQ